MTTAETIIARLPICNLLTVTDLVVAIGVVSPATIIRAIQEGTLEAIKVSGRYVISRESAIRYISNSGKKGDE